MLDTNLLVLLVVGSVAPEQVGVYKRLKAYELADFTRLKGIVDDAGQLVITPNTMTETSNLIRGFTGGLQQRIDGAFRRLVEIVSTSEVYVRSRDAVALPEFARLGLADAVLLSVTDASTCLVTADLGLYLAACNRGQKAVHFTTMRNL